MIQKHQSPNLPATEVNQSFSVTEQPGRLGCPWRKGQRAGDGSKHRPCVYSWATGCVELCVRLCRKCPNKVLPSLQSGTYTRSTSWDKLMKSPARDAPQSSWRLCLSGWCSHISRWEFFPQQGQEAWPVWARALNVLSLDFLLYSLGIWADDILSSHTQDLGEDDIKQTWEVIKSRLSILQMNKQAQRGGEPVNRVNSAHCSLKRSFYFRFFPHYHSSHCGLPEDYLVKLFFLWKRSCPY